MSSRGAFMAITLLREKHGMLFGLTGVIITNLLTADLETVSEAVNVKPVFANNSFAQSG
jgi:hypothetical protein